MTRFLYFAPADAAAHSHIHALKVQSLRDAGIQAERVVVSWGREALAPKGPSRRQDCRRISAGHRRLVGTRVALCVVNALREADVVIQALRLPGLPMPALRRVATTMRRRFRGLVEFEGDGLLESDYLARHPYKDGFYDQAIRVGARYGREQVGQARKADGLVLMSEEHIRLWEERLGYRPNAVAMPALFDPTRMRFDPTERAAVREALGLFGRTVLVYVGNVFCSWQRFGAACRLTARLASRDERVVLLALVRAEDHQIAAEFIARYAIGDRARLVHVPPERVHAYLSASDLGLFLRADHPMNRIVTSAKLGEYLACGLPVVTTGVGALYHAFVRETGAGVFIDPAVLDRSQDLAILALAQRSADDAWRAALSRSAAATFAGGDGPLAAYVRFVKGTLP